ncbi:MAG: glycosyltransferase family 1 protein [Alcaligenaceae bacterium]|nr:glycosyltransferase family 1 protein [Alcaligenaceae bacterium]
MHKRLLILGTRGVPAQHGGFETFAEELSTYLVQKGWRVTVYCQEEWNRTVPYETMWGRVRRVHIPVKQSGALGTMVFDLKAVLHARRQPTMALTLGYNTALFNLLQRVRGRANLFNMDGVEYTRAKWGFFAKLWLRINERIACWTGTHLIADHPLIKEHLATRTRERRITMIPYGADAITDASTAPVRALGLEPGKYSTVIARPEPENSLLEIVQGFSQQPRGHTLVVLGDFLDHNPYHQRVLASASPEVKFVGAIYDKATVRALRYHSYLYVHGHQVGGTNPSLVEALGAGNPVLAHDNGFNRWVTGDSAAVFFQDAASCAQRFADLLANPDQALAMKKAARLRHAEQFTWEQVLADYEKLLTRYNPYQPDPEGWEQYLED